MKKGVKLIAILLFFTCSCSKNQDTSKLIDYCTKGDVYTYDIYDAHFPNHTFDSFRFIAANGYHVLYWKVDSLHQLEIKVKNFPIANDSMIYVKSMVSNINVVNKGISTSGLYVKDSLLKIVNKNDSFIISFDPISFGTQTIKACKLKMFDINPL